MAAKHDEEWMEKNAISTILAKDYRIVQLGTWMVLLPDLISELFDSTKYKRRIQEPVLGPIPGSVK